MRTFFKANLASLLATGVDYIVAMLLFEAVVPNALLASLTGTLAGGILHFSLSRRYVFGAGSQRMSPQVLRYLLTWVGNVLLNVLLVYVLAEKLGIHFLLSKISSSILIFIAFNYPLHRRFVFKTMEQK